MANAVRKLRDRDRTSKGQARDRLKRSSRASISYREDSSDKTEEEYSSSISESDSPPSKRQKRAAASGPSSQTSISQPPPRKPKPKPNQRNHARPLEPAKYAVQGGSVKSDGVIPAWSSLPYDILLETFSYAFGALRHENQNLKKAISWVLDTACICKAFTEPALSALYCNPPVLDRSWPHELMALLAYSEGESSKSIFKYGVKVKRLELEVESILAKKTHGIGMFDVAKMIPHLPQLSELCIYLDSDSPPYRGSDRSIRWHYPDSLFSALESSQNRLRSFKWNCKLFGDRDALPWMTEVHRMKAFQTLRHLTVTNFSFLLGPMAETAETMALNCAVLPTLESVCFQSSPGVVDILLKRLPQTLKKVKFENCISIDSDGLHSFLESHGLQLKELVLLHNRALDLAFLPHLKRTAPGLELLEMDMNYFYEKGVTFRGSDPLYHTLLVSDERPSWPQTLRVLEMTHLRKWENLEAATHFFQSLVDSARELPDLRKLVLKVILNSSWRDRAGFRDKWIPRMQKVFLRKTDPPNPNLVSLRAFRDWKDSESSENLPGTPKIDIAHEEGIKYAGRRLKLDMVSISPRKQTPVRGGSPRRTRQSGRLARIESSSSEMTPSEGEESHGDVLQGMCEIVDIIIDNQRPREALFNEDDFMDSEQSGDEDWTGENDAVADDGYAW